MSQSNAESELFNRSSVKLGCKQTNEIFHFIVEANCKFIYSVSIIFFFDGRILFIFQIQVFKINLLQFTKINAALK